VIEHIDGRHLGIDAKFLRQIAENAADLILVLEDVQVIQPDLAGIGILQGGHGTHQGGFTGAVGTWQTEPVGADGQAQTVQSARERFMPSGWP